MNIPYNSDNIFAKILRGEIPHTKVYENEFSLAFEDINPQAPVHVLIIPKGRYVSIDDFSKNASDKEIAGLVRAIGCVASMLGISGNGYRILSNIGKDGNQEVPHLHIHMFAGKKLGPMIKSS